MILAFVEELPSALLHDKIGTDHNMFNDVKITNKRVKHKILAVFSSFIFLLINKSLTLQRK